MPVENTLSNAFIGENTTSNVDNSVTTQLSNSSLRVIDARRYTTISRSNFSTLSSKDSIRSLRTHEVTRTQDAEDRAKKRLPVFTIGLDDILRNVDVKLEQILCQLELIQHLGYDPTIYSKLESQYDDLIENFNSLMESKPSGWANPFSVLGYRSSAARLKASAKVLYRECSTASQAARKVNVKLRNLQRFQRDIKASPHRAGSEWVSVLEAIRDSDDEDDASDDLQVIGCQ